ncbi:hypothetical protein [Synechococcus sp. WH 8016]|uniref:hypothetical protein n=1 Tax=Synechococcus sp. WH 8016 TaxID=166318 RepID=UPI001145CB40|nr:hypothetical protein [Synechococcus sp. WH 8016]
MKEKLEKLRDSLTAAHQAHVDSGNRVDAIDQSASERVDELLISKDNLIDKQQDMIDGLLHWIAAIRLNQSLKAKSNDESTKQE